MSVEAISGAVYRDAAKVTAKSKVEIANGNGSNSINITEVPNSPNSVAVDLIGKDGNNNGTASEKQIKDAVNKVNNQLRLRRTNCEFAYHEETKRVSIKVIDSDTKEIVREIPPEETQDMVQKMWELAGILVDERR